MFYDDFCKTDNQKAVYEALIKLSKSDCYIAIQELDYLGLSRKELEGILADYERKGLLKEVQHLGESHPVLFRL